MPPRASSPVGIALLDKPTGPVVVRSRRADPVGARGRRPATPGRSIHLHPGSCCCCPEWQLDWPLLRRTGQAHATDVDLTSTTSTGDPEGEVLESHEPPAHAELESLLEGLRGEVELPIPAASAVEIGGERAYKLARRGIAVEMPVRRSPVYALDVITYTGDAVQLGLHVGSARTLG